jgi:SAM-dependent methyltransferase
MGVRDALQRPWIIRAGQFAVTGEWNFDSHRRLADVIRQGPHDSILDLGCGRAPLLTQMQPERYVGLDLHPPDLAYAERHHGRPGYEFVEADIVEDSLERWRGIDVVTSAGVFHHLTDDQVSRVLDRVADQIAPKRYVFYDSVVHGPLSGFMARIDYGDPTRQPEELYELFKPRFEVRETWSYVVPFRTGRLFGFELVPAQVPGRT